ncbi:MAG: fluoride efflux transporter CrcB [Planctomycetes bacterium]|nr:fluoride efflux transporter CrcB [Planctomycetota bacterium]
MVQKIVCLALAGAVGTLARYLMGGLVQRCLPTEFPWATALINITGCLLFGIVWALSHGRLELSPQLRAIVFIGFFGSFTTFSTFMFETTQLLDQAQWFRASANLLLQNCAGMVCVWLGLIIGRCF